MTNPKYSLLMYTDRAFRLLTTFNSKDELIRHIIRRDYTNPFLIETIRNENPILNGINMNGNDCYENGMIRPYMILDEYDRIIDPRAFMADIERYRDKRNNTKYSYVNWRLKNYHFEFRKDPVPFTGVRHWQYFRHVKHWFRTYKEQYNPDHKDFIRKKAMVPNVWDTEPPGPRYRSWKENSKKRHQWE